MLQAICKISCVGVNLSTINLMDHWICMCKFSLEQLLNGSPDLISSSLALKEPHEDQPATLGGEFSGKGGYLNWPPVLSVSSSTWIFLWRPSRKRSHHLQMILTFPGNTLLSSFASDISVKFDLVAQQKENCSHEQLFCHPLICWMFLLDVRHCRIILILQARWIKLVGKEQKAFFKKNKKKSAASRLTLPNQGGTK